MSTNEFEQDDLNNFGSAKNSNRHQRFANEDSNTSSSVDQKISSQALNYKDWLQETNTNDRSTLIKKLGQNKKAKPGSLQKQNSVLGFASRTLDRLLGKMFHEVVSVADCWDEHIETFWGGSLDAPKEGEILSAKSQILVGGWIVARKQQPAKVRLTLNGQYHSEFPIQVDRPDVAQALFFVPSEHSIWGYNTLVPLNNLPDKTVLKVEAIFADGQTNSIGTVQLKRV